VFAVCTSAITAYLWLRDPRLLERRLNAGPTGEQRRSQQIIQTIASLAFVALYVVAGLDQRFGWSAVAAPISIIADVVVAAGLLVVFLVFRENTFTSATIEVASDQTVISTGPYACVRHPMYAGALLILLATPVGLGSWWGLLMVVPMVVVIVWRLLDEERYLAENLPGYSEYSASVPKRLLPRIW